NAALLSQTFQEETLCGFDKVLAGTSAPIIWRGGGGCYSFTCEARIKGWLYQQAQQTRPGSRDTYHTRFKRSARRKSRSRFSSSEDVR
ncbi:hypothetical protein M9458_038882, partial [Cirrhinus mrigala]